MPLSQDLLHRATKVQWAGGEYLLLYVDGRHSQRNTPSPIDVYLTCPELGWDRRAISHGSLVEKTTGFENNPTTEPVPKFDVSPNLKHAYPFYEEQRSRTTTGTTHVLDRGLYGIILRSSGEEVNSGTNGFGTVILPFIIDYTGDLSGGGGLDVRTPDGTSTWYANIALAKAIDLGLGGFDWDVNFISEISGHDDTSGVTNTTAVANRLIFINWSKLKAQLKADDKKKVEIKVEFDASVGVIGGKTTFYGVAELAIYLKSSGFADWPVKESADVSDAAFQELREWDDGSIPPGFTAWPPGAPAFFPPNIEDPGYPQRLPDPNPTGGAIQDIATGETKKGPGWFTFTITLAGTDGPDDPPTDKVEVSDPEFLY